MKESNKKKNHKQKTVFPNKNRGSFFMRFIVMFVLCFLVLFSSGASAAWQSPPGAPTADNIEPPINVGDAGQGKLGSLFLYGNPISLTTDYNTYLSGLGGNVVVGSFGPASQKLHVQGGAYISGNLGIGVPSPVQKLDVLGTAQTTGLIVNGNADINGTTETDRLRVLDGNFAAGNALISDGAGNASWTKYDWYNVARIPPDIIYGGGAVNIIPKFTSVNPWRIGESIMSESGGNTININGSANIANNLMAGGLTVNNRADITGWFNIEGLFISPNLQISGNGNIVNNVNVGGLVTSTNLRINGDADIISRFTTLNLTVNNDALFNGLLTARDLFISENATIVGTVQTRTLGVTGAANIGGTVTSTGLTVNGNGNITGTLGIVGTLTSGGLTVNGNGSVTGTLGVSGVVTAPRIQINGDANVTGRTTTRDLTVNNTATFNGLLTVQTLISVLQDAFVGVRTQTETLQVTNNANIGGRVTSTGLTVNGNGNGNIAGTLGVGGTLTTSANLQVSGNGTVTGNANTGTLGIAGGLTVGTLTNTRSLRVLDGNRFAGNTLLSDGAGNASWGQYSWTNIINMPPNFMAGEIDWSKVINKPPLVNTVTSANGRITVAPNSGNVVITRNQPTWADIVNRPTNLITGFGTANRLTRFTGTYTIGNAGITESGGNLSVPGSITISGTLFAPNIILSGNITGNKGRFKQLCVSGDCKSAWPPPPPPPSGGCKYYLGQNWCPFGTADTARMDFIPGWTGEPLKYGISSSPNGVVCCNI